MKFLLLLRGMPGAGKSTLAELLSPITGNVVWFEADQYFKDGKFDGALLKPAHMACQENTQKALQRGDSVIVANTSTTEIEVGCYEEIARYCGAMFFSVVVENRHDGVSCHNVPPETMYRMLRRFTLRL